MSVVRSFSADEQDSICRFYFEGFGTIEELARYTKTNASTIKEILQRKKYTPKEIRQNGVLIGMRQDTPQPDTRDLPERLMELFEQKRG